MSLIERTAENIARRNKIIKNARTWQEDRAGVLILYGGDEQSGTLPIACPRDIEDIRRTTPILYDNTDRTIWKIFKREKERLEQQDHLAISNSSPERKLILTDTQVSTTVEVSTTSLFLVRSLLDVRDETRLVPMGYEILFSRDNGVLLLEGSEIEYNFEIGKIITQYREGEPVVARSVVGELISLVEKTLDEPGVVW